MGLETREAGKYITIYNGKFCRRVPEGTEGAVSRVNKIGKTVYELFYDKFTGKLVDIKIKESADYGKSWEFILKDDEEQYNLQLSYSNSFATAFLKMLPNIDLTKNITLNPSVKMVEGKNQSSLFINQEGHSIKHAYTKDVPNGLPPMVKILVKGQEMWDDSDRLIFLTNMVNEKIIPQLGKEKISAEGEQKSMSLDEAFPDDKAVDDDQPF